MLRVLARSRQRLAEQKPRLPRGRPGTRKKAPRWHQQAQALPQRSAELCEHRPRFVRHPLYLGELTALLGIAVGADRWALAVPLWLICAALQLVRTGYEERSLRGQAVLKACLPLIEELAARATSEGTEMESFIPFLDIASARHAQADLRLFAN